MSPTDMASAALFDLTGWTVLSLSGADAVKFLHNFCTADIKGLRPGGEGCEAFLTNVKARIVGHVGVFPYGYAGMGLALLTTHGQAERLAAHLDRYVITEDVTISDHTDETALFYAGGPAAGRLERFMDHRPASPAPGRFPHGSVEIEHEGGRLGWLAYRVDWFASPGYLIWMPRVRRDDTREILEGKGFTFAPPETFEALRIESGFPLYGVDVTEDHLAPEVGRPWAISYAKGCYLGQEPIARIDALGHVNRLLCGLRLDSDVAPPRGAAIAADGKEVGAVTSAASAGGRSVALGYIKTKFVDPGTRLTVHVADREIPATVYRPAGP